MLNITSTKNNMKPKHYNQRRKLLIYAQTKANETKAWFGVY